MTYPLKYWLARIAEFLSGRPSRKMRSRPIRSRRLFLEGARGSLCAIGKPGGKHQSRFADSSPSYLTNVNGTLFFFANDGTHGDQLWESNGTAAGTVMVKDINGTVGANPKYLTEHQRHVVLHRQRRGSWRGIVGKQWRRCRNLHGQGHQPRVRPARTQSYLTNVNGTLFFSAARHAWLRVVDEQRHRRRGR